MHMGCVSEGTVSKAKQDKCSDHSQKQRFLGTKSGRLCYVKINACGWERTLLSWSTPVFPYHLDTQKIVLCMHTEGLHCMPLTKHNVQATHSPGQFPLPNKTKWATNVSPGEFHRCVSIHVRQQAEAEALRIGGISETVHSHRWLRSMKRLPHSLVELVVRYGTPESRFTVSHRLKICRGENRWERHLWGVVCFPITLTIKSEAQLLIIFSKILQHN